jgi:hypothetical protein
VKRSKILVTASAILGAASIGYTSNNLHTSWLWHLHQPIYWPDQRVSGNDHYEAAWDTIQQQDAGRPHPNPEPLRTIFGWDDRVAAYQGRLRDSLGTILWLPKSGVQVSYSGALMENVQSLGAAGQLGYGGGWYLPNRQARGWTTSGGKTRMDLVNFTYHHSLAPLLSEETLEMELRIHKRHMEILWGDNPPVSRGFFPTETCFSTRMVPILKRVGIDWAIVANSHLSRSCADFPLVIGSGGENCDIPNKADQLNPAQGASNYKRISIDRGISPAAAMPFAFQVHHVRHVDPQTGEESKLIIVPSDQALGWKDSYGTWDLNLLNDLAVRNDPNKPAIAIFAHDGDNAWSGGYSYYMEWVQNFASQANGRGYEVTTIEQFLQDHPPDPNDIVHIEDGGWVYADSDFGSPMFINWHWPPSYSTNVAPFNIVDPSLGVSDKADNWRVIIATENRVKTAQQIAGVTPRIDQVRDPWSFGQTPNAVELGWHYYLGGLDGGFVYYGCHGDMCHRSVVAQSNAVRHVNSILAANPDADTTPPTVFSPQRHPWNPGATNFGVQYQYRVTTFPNTDFFVWTYAYDVSGIANVKLLYRANGSNAPLPTDDQFHTYAGGPNTGPWQTNSMTQRVVAPIIGASPPYIADYYYTKVTGLHDTYVDYYVEATDNLGNTYKSPIQHVYVAPNPGGPPPPTGCNGRVCVEPIGPVAGQPVKIIFNPASGPLSSAPQVYIHLGWNNWSIVLPDAAMTSVSNKWEYTTTITNIATQLDCVFNNGAGTWDNNGGADWHFPVTGGAPPQPPDVPQDLTATVISSNQIDLAWSSVSNATHYCVYRDGAKIATTTALGYSDLGLLGGLQYCYTVASSNAVGLSAQSPQVCATTPGPPEPASTEPFVLDGAVDHANYLQAENGMTLYAAVRGHTLYVATWSPGTNGPNDHFIVITDETSALTNAMWAKAGQIACHYSPKPYLGGESANTYVGWFNGGPSAQSAKAPTNSGQMEGTINLIEAFGYLPTNLCMAALAYQTADGGELAAQVPAGNGNGNVEANEFFCVPLSVLIDNNADGTYDRLDPTQDFLVLAAERNPGGTQFIVNWASVPGKTYRVQSTDDPETTPFDDITDDLTAAAGQTSMSYTNDVEAGVTKRFYRVRLVNP